MKPDFIDIIDDEDLTLNGDSEENEKQTSSPAKILFSLIAKKDTEQIKKRIPHIINKFLSDPVYETLKSDYRQEDCTLVIIGIRESDSQHNASNHRRCLTSFCNILSASLCSVAVKINGNIDVKHFFRDEINYNPEEIPDFPKTFRELYKNIEEMSNDSIDLKEDVLRDYIKSFYISKGLMIRNIDSDIVLQDETIDFAKGIIEKAINDNNGIVFPQPTDPIHHMMYYPEINPDIPILLKKSMPEYDHFWKDIEDKRKKRYIPQGAVLGYYTKDDEDFCKGSHIVLCPEAINQLSADTEIPFRVIFAKTLVHELAHAMIDNSKNWPSSLEAKAMEESLANMITLEWFKEYAPEDEKYVKCFIDNWQSSIYKFGIWQDKIDAVWDDWRGSTKQTTPKLKEWFDLCFAGGNIKIPIEDYTKEIYNKVFE